MDTKDQPEDNNELCIWKKGLQDAYLAIRTDQKANDELVLGHRHMYGELAPSCLIRIFDCFKRKCNLNSDSVFVDLGCGHGKVVYMAYRSGIQESIGIEQEETHLEVMQKSMRNLGATDVNIIEGLIEENLQQVHHVTHLYSFDWLFSDVTLNAIYCFLRERIGTYWASFRKPADLLENNLSFQILETIDGKMSRSPESHKCYVYKIVAATYD